MHEEMYVTTPPTGGVRQSGEDYVCIALQLIGDNQMQPRQVREDLGQALTSSAAAGNGNDLKVRVAVEDTGELSPPVSGDVDDRCLH